MGCCPTVCRRSAVLLLELESAIWGVEHPSRTIPQGARQGGFRSENVFVYYEGTNTTVGMDRFAGYNMGEPDGIRGPKTARENGGLRHIAPQPVVSSDPGRGSGLLFLLVTPHKLLGERFTVGHRLEIPWLTRVMGQNAA